MDSATQLILGAAVNVAGTLHDLDVFIAHGDPVLNMVLHRAESHVLFWLTLFSLPLSWLVARVQEGEWAQWRRWWHALWLALVTHPLLDAFAVYGTQLLLPSSLSARVTKQVMQRPFFGNESSEAMRPFKIIVAGHRPDAG